MVVYNSTELLANCFDVKMLLQPSASIPDGRALPLVLTTALVTMSASTLSSVIGCTSWDVSGKTTLKFAALPCGCFWFNWFKVAWFNARILLCMLSFKCFMALETLFHCSFHKQFFLEILEIDDIVFGALGFVWMVSLSCAYWRISPRVHW